MTSPPRVSVVIPTIGRPELASAIQSVRSQVGVETEIVVVADLAEDAEAARSVRAAAGDAEVVFTGGGRRGAHGRNIGIQTATSEWIAFLDDDDLWLDEKLITMVDAAVATGATVISSRVDQQMTTTGATVASGIPVGLLRAEQDPAEYLFRKRRPGSGRASLFTSTLLVARELAVSVPWDALLSRHQDWDWILRLSEHPQYRFHHVPETLTIIRVGSASSISAGSDWEPSFAWAERSLSGRDPRVYVDFLFGQTLRYALQARSVGGVRRVVGEAWRVKRLPSLGPVMIGAAGILGRRGVERAMATVR